MTKLPPWFKQKIPAGTYFNRVIGTLDALRLNTVCESAACPNRTLCYSRGTSTFMILGEVCTRNCSFCAVSKGIPSPPDAGEPERVSEAIETLGMKHAVITSVTRDDLPDGGAGQFALTVKAVRSRTPRVTVELLIPDIENLDIFSGLHPEVIGHNLETVPRLYPELRPRAGYEKSLKVLKNIKLFSRETVAKSALMLGLGETSREIESAMDDLRAVDCDMLCLGQYLRPSGAHFPVKEYISPETFAQLRQTAISKGFRAAISAPLARSSYMAGEMFSEVRGGNN